MHNEIPEHSTWNKNLIKYQQQNEFKTNDVDPQNENTREQNQEVGGHQTAAKVMKEKQQD